MNNDGAEKEIVTGDISYLKLASDIGELTQALEARCRLFTASTSNVDIVSQIGSRSVELAEDLGYFAERLWKERQRRTRFFCDRILGEPGWDIMLYLFKQHRAGKRSFVKDVFYASGVPGSTALRWLDVLVGEGLLERRDDAKDGRRQVIKMTNEGVTRMTAFLMQVLGVNVQNDKELSSVNFSDETIRPAADDEHRLSSRR